MPFIHAQILAGHSTEQKQALLKNANKAVQESIGAPEASIRITLQEFQPHEVMVAGQEGKAFATIQVHLIEGRTEALKAALIAALSQAASESLGISQEEIRVMAIDVPKENMGVAGGISAKAAGR
ncbi:4-oxalocrotonate tautomerase [Advenella faeciporci]|uniref:4-oxalocrotonate tautomerase n=1 Tax=Advenella faeciporci TaxID=797535 RepID=A0A918JPB0_9BURK|nr:tautomerase family protein [Advenella faeciporci]GGW94672.1 4-oxalocrotonate tautomerase [Advenella faeciporci]